MDYIKTLNQLISSKTGNERGQKMERWDTAVKGTKEAVKEKKIIRWEAKTKIYIERGHNENTLHKLLTPLLLPRHSFSCTQLLDYVTVTLSRPPLPIIDHESHTLTLICADREPSWNRLNFLFRQLQECTDKSPYLVRKDEHQQMY